MRGAHVHVALLDDGNREEMERLATRHGARYVRRTLHQGAKAGNINHALGRHGRAVRARARLRPRPARRHARGDAARVRRPVGRLRADAAVLRQLERRADRRRGVEPAGVVLRPDRPGQGPPRFDVLLRHERRVPPHRARVDRRVPDRVADRGLRAVRRPPRDRVDVGVRPAGAGQRPRTRGPGGLRQPAAPVGPRLHRRDPAPRSAPTCRGGASSSTCCRRRTSCPDGPCWCTSRCPSSASSPAPSRWPAPPPTASWPRFAPYFVLSLATVASVGGGAYTFAAYSLATSTFWIHVHATYTGRCAASPGRSWSRPKLGASGRQWRPAAPTLAVIAVLAATALYGLAQSRQRGDAEQRRLPRAAHHRAVPRHLGRDHPGPGDVGCRRRARGRRGGGVAVPALLVVAVLAAADVDRGLPARTSAVAGVRAVPTDIACGGAHWDP